MSILDKVFPDLKDTGDKLKNYFTVTAVAQVLTTIIVFMLFLKNFKVSKR